MDLFDSLLHAFGVAGTGGFGIKNGSITPYENAYVEWVIGIGMLAFGINFNMIYLLLIGNIKQVFKSEELKWYFLIVLGAVGLICINLIGYYDSISKLIRDVFHGIFCHYDNRIYDSRLWFLAVIFPDGDFVADVFWGMCGFYGWRIEDFACRCLC